MWHSVLARLARGSVALLATGAATLAFGVASASAAKNLIANGSFETGDFSGWTTSSTTGCQGWEVLSSPSSTFCFHGKYGCPSSISAAKGSHFADVTWDGAGGSDPMLSQTVVLPRDSKVKLSWSDNTCWNLRIAPVTMARVEYVDILNGSGSAILHSYTIQTLRPHTKGHTGWVSRNLALSRYAGKTVQIRFRLTVPESFSGPANFAIDAIALHAAKN